MSKKLTLKQEKFCCLFIETGNASESYRMSYSCNRMKNSTVHVKASELLNNGKVTVRLAEIRAEHAERHNVNVDSITNELEEARQMAINTEAPAAMVTASMGKAKLHGIIIDKAQVDVTVNPIEELMNSIAGTALRPSDE